MIYRIRRLLSTPLGAFGEYYRFEDEDGVTRFSVESKLPAFWPTVTMRAAPGNLLFTIQRRGFAPQSFYRISRDDHEVAAVRQHWVGGHMHFTVEINDAQTVEIIGDWHAQAFNFVRDDHTIARDVGPWFTVNAPHDISIEPGQDEALILACAVVIQWTNELDTRNP